MIFKRDKFTDSDIEYVFTNRKEQNRSIVNQIASYNNYPENDIHNLIKGLYAIKKCILPSHIEIQDGALALLYDSMKYGSISDTIKLLELFADIEVEYASYKLYADKLKQLIERYKNKDMLIEENGD